MIRKMQEEREPESAAGEECGEGWCGNFRRQVGCCSFMLTPWSDRCSPHAAERLFLYAKKKMGQRFKEVRGATNKSDLDLHELLDSRVFPTREVWYSGTWRYLPGETRRKIVVTRDKLCIGYEGMEVGPCAR